MSDSKVSTFVLPTKIYSGINSHEKLNEVITDWGIDKLFFLYDEGIKGTEIFKSVENILRENQVAFEVFSEIEPDPSADTVEKAYDAYRTVEAPALLAVGGGSTIDVGKAVGIIATNGGCIQDYEGIDKFVNPCLLQFQRSHLPETSYR